MKNKKTILIIIIALVLAISVILFFVLNGADQKLAEYSTNIDNNKVTEEEQSPAHIVSDNNPVVSVIPEEVTNPKNTEQKTSSITPATPIPEVILYNVSFLSMEGLVLSSENVEPGSSLIPPNIDNTPDGYIFIGWDHDTMDIHEDMTIKSLFTNVSEMNNVFALTTRYTNGNNMIEVPVQLCGLVNLCAFDIRINYDTEKLILDSFENLDGGIVANCNEDTGVILMNFVQISNIEGGFNICGLKFQPLTDEKCETDIIISIEKAIMITDNNELESVKTSIINCKVYIN